MSIPFSRFTNDKARPLTKRFHLDADGVLQKTSAAQLFAGEVGTVSVDNLTEFAGELVQARHHQAFAYGVCGLDHAAVVAKDMLARHPGAVARDREHFGWSAGGGILFLDYDPPKGGEALERDDLIAAIRGAVPFLADVEMLWRPSSSSNIMNTDTLVQLRGIAGQRLYLIVDQAARIPDIGAAIDAHLWANGFGRFDISKSGALLPRTLVDASVWQPERLDFVAGALCVSPLSQFGTNPVLIPGEVKMLRFDSITQPDLDNVKQRKAWAREEVKPKQEAVREGYIEEQAQRLAAESGGEPDTALNHYREVMRQAVDGKLFADFKLLHTVGAVTTSVTVGEVLDNPKKWHNQRFADPLEPDYGNDKRIAWLNLFSGSRPYIHSHAHGGRRFGLYRQPRVLQLPAGDLPGNADRCAELLALDGGVYDFGGALVYVKGDRTTAVNVPWLQDRMGRLAQFLSFDGRSGEWRRCNLPKDLAAVMIAKGGGATMPSLTAICTTPTMLPDGEIVEAPGIHEGSGLLLLAEGAGFEPVPKSPTAAQVKGALAALWRPFADFPFIDKSDQSVHWAALLTAVVRVSLPTSPGFAYDAPTAGSGKTLLASCVTALATGQRPAISSPFTTEDETRKAITSSVLFNRRVMLVDNQVFPLDSAALASFLTGTEWSDRVLGKNEMVSMPIRSLFIVTGNNLRLVGDINRRILTCRIDPQTEASKTFMRAFPLDPLDYVLHHRKALATAALTVLRAYVAAGRPRTAPGRMASFEAWDDLVRQTLCWLAAEGYLDVGDPLAVLEAQAELDPEAIKLAALLHAWATEFGHTPTTVAEAIRRAGIGGDYGAPALFDALDEIAGERGGVNPRRAGRWIEARAGKILDGLKFERCGSGRTGVALWRVRGKTSAALYREAA